VIDWCEEEFVKMNLYVYEFDVKCVVFMKVVRRKCSIQVCSWKKKYKNPVFLWQEYHVVVTTKYTYIYNNNIELWIYAVYLIIENEKIEKKTIYYIYIQQTPKLRAVEEKETTFGINYYHTWFYFFEKLWSFLLYGWWWWSVDNARWRRKKKKKLKTTCV